MPDIKLREERTFPLLPLPPQNLTVDALRDWTWAITRELQKFFAGGGLQTQQIMFREDGRTVTDHDGHYVYTSAGTTVIEKSIFKTNYPGDVAGPANATDNVWARFDGTTGKLLQNGLWVEADTGDVSAGGALAMQDNVLSRPELKDYAETSTSANSGTSLSFSLENGNVFQVLMTGNCTFTFNNPPADGKAGSFTVLLKQDGTGSRTATWPAAVKWAGGSAPTLTTTANKVDILTFITRNAGTDWYGFVGGKNF
jgi:hypothetical protein